MELVSGFQNNSAIGGAGSDTVRIFNGIDVTGATFSGIEFTDIVSPNDIDIDADQVANLGLITLSGTAATVGRVWMTLHDGAGQTAAFNATLQDDEFFLVRTSGLTDADTIMVDFSGVTFNGSSYANFLGGSGNDSVAGGSGGDDLRGGIDNDTLNGLGGDDTLQGDDGDDSLDGGAGNDTLNGGNGIDTLNGGGGRDAIFGNSDNDTIDGGAGRDTMDGGNGNDTYFVDEKGDTIVEASGGGIDVVFASGSFRLDSQVENLTLAGLTTDNITGIGNGLDNVIEGDAGSNLLKSNGGDDTVSGFDGADRLEGLAGDDSLTGGEGDDAIFGGNGADICDGGSGEDVFAGGVGNDTLTGGGGADVFRYRGNFGKDDITDFEDGVDRFNFKDLRVFNGDEKILFGQLLLTQKGANAHIELDFDEDGLRDEIDLDGNGNTDNVRIDLLDINVSQLDGSDFVLLFDVIRIDEVGMHKPKSGDET